MDVTFILSAAIFTLLAIVVATSLLNGSSSSSSSPSSSSSSSADLANARRCFGRAGDSDEPLLNGHAEKKKAKKKAVDDWCEISGSSHDHWDVVKSVQSTEGATESPTISDKLESNDDDCLKYLPGKSRSHHMEMMMSSEELEEEQRVQREQLAAIFQLLKDNKETFGEVSEGDMEEQLKLYSI